VGSARGGIPTIADPADARWGSWRGGIPTNVGEDLRALSELRSVVCALLVACGNGAGTLGATGTTALTLTELLGLADTGRSSFGCGVLVGEVTAVRVSLSTAW
jgi:hypothetical protein